MRMDFKQKALLLCKEMSACDDRLGKYSDYEGTEDGPTFYLWEQGVEDFDAQCKAAIRQHAIAIAAWRKFQKLNRFRAIANEQSLEACNVDDLSAAITRTHNSINGAIQRCTNPKNTGYHDYGARGITVCEHWRASYRQFIIDMGLRPIGLSLDRKDNSKGYLCPLCCPPTGNCEWATNHAQRINQRPRKRKERIRTPKGETMLAWWAEQSDEYKLARNVNARAVAGNALDEWRTNKDTTCLRCGWSWAKTIQSRSRVCPKCHSSKWDVPLHIAQTAPSLV